MMLRHISSYIPAVAVSLIIGFAIVFAAYSSSILNQPSETNPTSFNPVETKPIRLLTPGPYTVGQTITIQNGVCNTTKETLQATTIIGFIETRVDRLLARNVVLRPDPTGSTAGTPLPRPLVSGCTGTDPVTGPLPLNLPPGHWQLYVIVNVMGGQAGQMQRINLISDEFEVIGAPGASSN
jgi:hypothetical protein